MLINIVLSLSFAPNLFSFLRELKQDALLLHFILFFGSTILHTIVGLASDCKCDTSMSSDSLTCLNCLRECSNECVCEIQYKENVEYFLW